MSAPVVRPAVGADAPALAALSGELGYPVEARPMAARVAEAALDPTRRVLVAELGGRVVGWLEWAERATLESGRTAEITGLVVGAPWRSAGVGRCLVEHAAREACGRGFTALRVRTNEVRTRTHGFYEKQGFRLAKSQRVYALDLDMDLGPGPGAGGTGRADPP